MFNAAYATHVEEPTPAELEAQRAYCAGVKWALGIDDPAAIRRFWRFVDDGCKHPRGQPHIVMSVLVRGIDNIRNETELAAGLVGVWPLDIDMADEQRSRLWLNSFARGVCSGQQLKEERAAKGNVAEDIENMELL